MALRISPVGNAQFFNGNGGPASGYQLFTYAEGTVSKVDVFTSLGGLAKHTNPIVLDALGFPPSPIYLDVLRRYKFVFALPDDTDPPNSSLYTWDGISSGIQIDVAASAEYVTGPFPTYISGTSFEVTGDLTEILATGRRVKLVSAAGIILGTILSSSFGGAVTTVTIIPDVGLIDPSVSAFAYGFLDSQGGAVPDCYFVGLTANFVGPLNINPQASFNMIPAGMTAPYAGTLVPSGWAFCYGQSLLRTAFPALFNAIGISYGSVDGQSFNVPDMRGCFPLGKDNMGGTAALRVTSASFNGGNAVTIGGRGGEQVHKLIIAELAIHNHAFQTATGSSGGGVLRGGSVPGVNDPSTFTGGDVAHNTMPPWLSLMYIIRLY